MESSIWAVFSYFEFVVTEKMHKMDACAIAPSKESKQLCCDHSYNLTISALLLFVLEQTEG